MANIPNQNTINEIIAAQVENTNSIVDAIVKAARSNVYSDETVNYLNSYNAVVTSLFGKDGVIISVLKSSETINKIDANKINRKHINTVFKTINLMQSHIKDFVSGLSDVKELPEVNFDGLTDLIDNVNKLKSLLSDNKNKKPLWFKFWGLKSEFKRTVKFIKDIAKISEKSLTNNIITGVKSLTTNIKNIFKETTETLEQLDSISVASMILYSIKLYLIRNILSDIIGIFKAYDEKEILKINKVFGSADAGFQGMIHAITDIATNLSKTVKDFLILISFKKDVSEALKTISKFLIQVNNEFSKIKPINKNIINNLSSLKDILDIINSMILTSLPVILFGWVVRSGIKFIGKLVDTINESFTGKKLVKSKLLDNLKDVVENIVAVEKLLAASIIWAAPAILGMLTTLVFLAALTVYVKTVNWISNFIGEIAEVAANNISKITKISIAILLVCGSIALLALLAPIMWVVIAENILPLLGMLTVFVVGLAVFAIFGWMLSKVAVKFTTELTLNIILIMGSLLVAGMVILFASFIGERLKDSDAIGNILLTILGMIAISAIMIGLGVALAALTPFVAGTILGLGQLAAIFALMLGAGLMIVALSNIDLGKERQDKAIAVIDSVVATVRAIDDKMGDVSRKDKRQWRKKKKMLRQVTGTVHQIEKIANTLNDIQNITLDKDKIITNVTNIISFTQTLNDLMQKLLFGGAIDASNPTGNSSNWLTRGLSSLFHDAAPHNMKNNMKSSAKVLSKVDVVIEKIVNIANALNQIHSITLDEKYKEKCINNLQHIFDFIEALNKKLVDFNGKSGKRAARKKKKENKQNTENMGYVSEIVGSVSQMTTCVEQLSKLKMDDKTEISIKNTLDTMFGLITYTSSKVVKTVADSNISTANANTDKIGTIIKSVNDINTSLKEITSVDDKKLKTTIDNYIRFVDKINTVEVNKLERSAQMFKQMASFSKSIKGNFEKLAESINEDLMPVLEELKEIMEKVPTAIETNGANVSAAVASTTIAPTTTNVTKQVERENPGMDKKQVEQLVQTRLKEHANSAANSTAAKIDELISLLKGYSGEHVVVQTV